MRVNVLILILNTILLINGAFAQMNKFPSGVYLSLEQLKNQTPAYNVDLSVYSRSKSEIAWSGGNDFDIDSEIDSITNKYIKKSIYAYVRNDSIFLNCYPHKLQWGFAHSLTSGNFLVFNSSMSTNKANTTAILGGALGAGLTANNRYLTVLSLRTGNARSLSKAYILERLKDHPDLLSQFNNESEPKTPEESETLLIRYINLLNQVTSPNVIPTKL